MFKSGNFPAAKRESSLTKSFFTLARELVFSCQATTDECYVKNQSSCFTQKGGGARGRGGPIGNCLVDLLFLLFSGIVVTVFLMKLGQ